METFDFAVIGAGSGGLAAARRAASHGAKVVLIENSRLGGTCVNLGCIPKKIMFYASTLSTLLNKTSKYYSFNVNSTFNWEEFVENRDKAIKRLNDIFQRHIEKANITRINSTGYLNKSSENGECSIVTEDGKEINAKEILIATGSKAVIPTLPMEVTSFSGKTSYPELISISDDFFNDIKSKPNRVVIIGAGYIGVEFACVLAGLGVEVIFCIRRERVLCGFDEMIQKSITEELIKNGVKVLINSQVNSVLPKDLAKYTDWKSSSNEWDKYNYEKTVEIVNSPFGDALNKNINILTENSQQQSEDYKKLGDSIIVKNVDFVVYTIGRTPNLECLKKLPNFEELLKKRQVEVKKNYNASNLGTNVWAVGDVIKQIMLTPVAVKQGRHLANKLFRDKTKEFEPVDLSYTPSVVFSHPPAGAIGLTEKTAKSKYGEETIGIKEIGFDGLFYNVPKQAGIPSSLIPKNKIKIVYIKESELILGLHLVGEFADEALQGFALALAMKAKLTDFDKVIAIHPTAAEDIILI